MIVGYQETSLARRIVAYDPYGEWTGVTGKYNLNTREKDSAKGRGVLYNFNEVIADGSDDWLIIASTPGQSGLAAFDLTSVPNSPPDVISDEPETIGDYEGININTSIPSEGSVYLPIIIK